jgi:hypothetical protein
MKDIQMAKYSAVFLLVSFLFAASACSSSGEEEGSGYEVEAAGTMERLEISTWMYGTHILVERDGEVLYALKSDTADLSSYEGKKVRVAGSLVPGYPVDGGPEYLKVEFIETVYR